MLGALHTALRAENIQQSTQMDVLNGALLIAAIWPGGKPLR